MSRTIKFRAWSPIAQKMYAVTSLEFDDDAIAEIAVKTHETDGLVYSSVFSANRLELMQFTGMLDKKGQEIFEGDLVRVEGYDEGEVAFGKACFLIRFTSGHLIALENTLPQWLEVIGNRYEKERS